MVVVVEVALTSLVTWAVCTVYTSPSPPPLSDQLQLVTGQMSLQLALSATTTTTAIVSLTCG